VVTVRSVFMVGSCIALLKVSMYRRIELVHRWHVNVLSDKMPSVSHPRWQVMMLSD